MTSTLPATRPQTVAEGDFKVADLSLAAFGRKEIRLAEHEMPGLMAMRASTAQAQPLRGRPDHRLAAHDRPDRRAHRDAGRARRRRCAGPPATSSPPRTTRPPRSSSARTAPPRHPPGVPVFAWKGETLDEYWWCTEQVLLWPDGGGPNMILDDGGDATLLVHKGVEFETAGAVPPRPTSRLRGVRRHPRRAAPLAGRGRRSAGPAIAAGIKGVTEETTTGVHRLYEMPRPARCSSRRSTSTTRSPSRKFDNKYGCRHSLIDGINRATDVLIGGKVAVVCGYGDVGKGCAESLRGQGARVIVTEIDPICALQAAMDGYQVATPGRRRRHRRHLHHRHRLLRRHHRRAHGADEAPGDRRATSATSTTRSTWPAWPASPASSGSTIKPQVDEWVFADGHSIIVLSEGRLLNLGNATGHPSLRDVATRSPTRRSPRSSCSPSPTSTRSASTCCPSTSTRRSPGCTSTPSASSSPS